MAFSTFKTLIIGDGGVGKTSLVRLLGGENFNPSYVATLGCCVEPMRIGKLYNQVVFNMWDLAGQEKFRGLDLGYYVATDIVIVCFDLTSVSTLEHCKVWIAKALEAKLERKAFILVGLKADCKTKQITRKMVYEMYPGLPYFEISNKTRDGREDLLSYLLDTFSPITSLASKL
jgi:GTP-binding nuclear protein Ran